MHRILFSGMLLAAVAAQADNQAIINITGVRLQHATDQARSSNPDTIDPGFGYTYVIDGQARGTSGLLGILFPSARPLGEILDTLQPGASEGLRGEVYHVGGTHPFTVVSDRFEGSTILLGTTVNFGATLSAFVDASNFAGFTITQVVMEPTTGFFRLGVLEFTSGTVTINRIPARTGDMNYDGVVNFDDIDAFVLALADPVTYVATYTYAPIYAGDCNRDGFFNFDDIDSFVSAIVGG